MVHRNRTDAAGAPVDLSSLTRGIPVDPLPPMPERNPDEPRAPARPIDNILTPAQRKIAVANALRYFPEHMHASLAPEFAEELRSHGHIYMHRFRPTEYEMKAHPITAYPAKSTQAAALMLMIQNNLDPAVAQFPGELVTYGGNGSAFSNWAQYHLTMFYLSTMTDEQTLMLYSGHPMGLFPSHKDAPRMVVTNGMVIPNYSSRDDYERMYACGVSQYGQMTAGSFCYIGPQGIVHGTTLTLLNAGRKYLGVEGLAGKLYVTAGLGGMSGAQPKAGVITGAVSIVAEISREAVDKRHAQGWVDVKTDDLDECLRLAKEAKAAGRALSIAYCGNVVDVWERLAELKLSGNDAGLEVDLGSDQTSCHNPFTGGYYPVGLSYEESQSMMRDDPAAFKEAVYGSLRRQVAAINTLVNADGEGHAMSFWDYGNSFLLESSRAGAEIMSEENPTEFRYPSYVEDIMGDIFSLGFGPFRWVCTSGEPGDLAVTDQIAHEVMASLRSRLSADKSPYAALAVPQLDDNILWITEADHHQLVVGSQARILYANAEVRATLGVAFNEAVKAGRLTAPVVLSRDHHDVSGTDAPWRETSNVSDGSKFTADMAIHNVIGDSFRGATSVSIHNGGGTGWGESMNGGFLMVLDGSDDATRRAENMLHFDVFNGVARRAWAGNDNAIEYVRDEQEKNGGLVLTPASRVSDGVLAGVDA